MTRVVTRNSRLVQRRAAYVVGHYATRLRGVARLAWDLAHGDQPVPSHLAECVVRVEESSDVLVCATRGAARPRAESARADLVRAARAATELVHDQWTGAEHRAGIDHRDRVNELLSVYPDARDDGLDPSARLDRAELFTEPCWQSLDNALLSLTSYLPDPLSAMTDLGRCTAMAFDEHLGDEDLARRLERLQRRLAEGAKDPLLSSLRLDVSARSMHLAEGRLDQWRWVRSQVWRLHQDVEVLISGDSGSTPGRCEAGEQPPTPDMTREMRLALVVGLLVRSQFQMPLTEAARLAGVNRTSCYRDESLNTVLESAAKAAEAERVRGRYVRGRAGESQLDAEFGDDETD